MNLTKTFASDNYSGAHEAVMQALVRANHGHSGAYGADPFTEHLQQVMRQHLGEHVETFPVFNGTGANVIALQALLPRWGAVISTSTAHIHVDEGGAPERVGGMKLLTVEGHEGKLTPELVDREAWGWGDEHRAQPLAVSISQTTELGTCYTLDEIRALADHAHERGMHLHVDGARISNAAAHLGVSLREMLTDTGVDIVSLGGTKNGLLGAEAIVVLNAEAAQGLTYLRKLNLQLGSKMRFLSAQLTALYEGDLWLRSASHANAMAQRLHAGLTTAQAQRAGIVIETPRESNAVFARVPKDQADRALARFHFYGWPGIEGLYRLMCSFDTSEAEVDELIALLTT